jgi:hypothetical protein
VVRPTRGEPAEPPVPLADELGGDVGQPQAVGQGQPLGRQEADGFAGGLRHGYGDVARLGEQLRVGM